MSDDLVTFNVRYEKSLFQLKIKTPEDVLGFVKKLKNELQVEDADEIILLYPTPEGKMMEIKSDADINFLKKTKMCYDAVNKQIYCSAELVVILLKNLSDDSRAQMMILSKNVDQLASQFTELSQSIDDKLKNNAANILKEIKCLFFKNVQSSADNTPKIYNSEELQDTLKLKKLKPVVSPIPKMEKVKLPSFIDDKLTNDSNQQEKSSTTIDIDTLLEKLKQEGFSNTIQNIIALKRFDQDYEKVVTYLKSNSAI
ncbi:Hypothetical protein CINCED_3A016401 [Cinara cedri]|uniref:Uncharacterized protein n=1 Tax=Cinara cedri TaxID=506608 RepID=A0A5E4MM54_9HEMI|nr:Hypothetical protein CINCED_3A016401 [Cinara cedri]